MHPDGKLSWGAGGLQVLPHNKCDRGTAARELLAGLMELGWHGVVGVFEQTGFSSCLLPAVPWLGEEKVLA